MIKLVMNRIIIYLSIVAYFSSCQRKETSLEYYDNGKSIKVKSELRDGKKDGKTIFYFENGQIQEVSEWRAGARDGKLISNYPSGKIKAKLNYSNGKVVGIAESYFESGKLKKVIYFDENGSTYDSKSYKPDGSMMDMEPIFLIDTDSAMVGDTVRFHARLANVGDDRFLSGLAIAGTKFLDNNMEYLADTLAMSETKFNDFNFNIIARKEGVNDVCIQLIYSRPITKNGQRGDSLTIFSKKGSFYVKP